MIIYCVRCEHRFEIRNGPAGERVCPSCGHTLSVSGDITEVASNAAQADMELGKFRLLELVGQGGFGKVYRALDTELDREVAIKIPTMAGWASSEEASHVLGEARSVARLQHPGIVAVFDIVPHKGSYFIVSEFVHGDSLAMLMRTWKPKWQETATLIARAAEALAYAHTHGVIHRDIKPGNILIDHEGLPHITDFGLALRERDESASERNQGVVVGTPAYMSTEQARGEGHRIDGRTDIYSLGVVFYELLAGRRPFEARSRHDLLTQILRDEPRPPRQIESRIPRELERICLKAMAKRVTERYTTAEDMAEDLRDAVQVGLEHRPAPSTIPSAPPIAISDALRESAAPVSDWLLQSNLTMPVRIVPKGLRAFEAEDRDAFLTLLPGPRDRDGLPESIRFWKLRIESTEEQGFPIGLIYGPSGCGKSSFVKAGLLPRLAEHVTSVFVECTPDDTETRLLKALRKGWPVLKDMSDLVQAVAMLRRMGQSSGGKKTLIVLDQFEQWLHVHSGSYEASPLLLALRHADGAHLQCLLLVRDEFWLGVSRFSAELEVTLTQDCNCRVMDLLPMSHARRVLELFGQAYGTLPIVQDQITAQQRAFVDDVALGLGENGMVIPIRLSLFADMMKGRPWTLTSLREVGGTEGVGVTFLEETFNGRGAVPDHRVHQAAARRALEALLPERGTEIKGRLRSRRELLEVSGYSAEPHEFQRLLQILDRELHLISPTLRVETTEAAGKPESRTAEDYYQLTHDYLVPSVREWLYRKRRETRRGRAELLLEERTSEWKRLRESRFLPSPVEYLSILTGVSYRHRKDEQRALMRAASRRYGAIASMLLLAATLTGWAAWEIAGRTHAEGLVRAIYAANPGKLEELIREDLPAYRRRADPLLAAMANNNMADLARRRRAALALVGVQDQHAELLRSWLLDCDVAEFPVIRNFLTQYSQVASSLWQTLRDQNASDTARFHAGMALAQYAPQDPAWSEIDAEFLAGKLVTSSTEEQRELRSYLELIRGRLTGPLRALCLESQSELVRVAAANALADFAHDDTTMLALLAAEATPEQLEVLYPALVDTPGHSGQAHETLLSLIREQPGPGVSEEERVRSGIRRAGAAITAMRMGERETTFDVFLVGADPESLTQFVHRSRPRGVTAHQVLECLRLARDERVRFGLLLALGDFPPANVPESERAQFVPQLLQWYAHDPSSAIHAACGWLLRTWGLGSRAREIDLTPTEPDTSARQWFVRRIGQDNCMTFVVFPPGEFLMGSSETERNRGRIEYQHLVRFSRTIAVADREVTREMFVRFAADRRIACPPSEWSPGPEHTIVPPNWYEAVLFCRWLTVQAGMKEQDQCYEDPAELEHLEKEQGPDGYACPRIWRCHPERPGFRLPSEAEWEYACRAGTTTAYSFGCDSNLLVHYARYATGPRRPVNPPGTLRPNLRGLFDMHGNAFEWCHDFWTDYLEGPVVDPLPQQESPSHSRILRGGGWFDNLWDCRSASRMGSLPCERQAACGIRVVYTLQTKNQ